MKRGENEMILKTVLFMELQFVNGEWRYEGH